MKVGLIGAGNMAAALARGWGEPVLHGLRLGRAAALAEELGGEAVGSNYELAVNADVVVLAHKPAQLEAVAREAAPAARAVVSLLAGRRSTRCGPPTRTRPSSACSRTCPPRSAAASRCWPSRPRSRSRARSRSCSAASGPSCGCPRRSSTPRRPARASGRPTGRWSPRRGSTPRSAAASLRRCPAAGHRDDGRQRRAAARPRPRHAAAAARGHLSGRHDRAGLAALERGGCARRSRPPWTTCWGAPDARRLSRTSSAR